MNQSAENATETPTPTVTMQHFLESVPPGTVSVISDIKRKLYNDVQVFTAPDIVLHCSSDSCGSPRTYSCEDDVSYSPKSKYFFFDYVCQNCKLSVKTFALNSVLVDLKARLFKYGELPAFGPPIPARAMTLIGADRDLFLKGRRCELQGLGVGAFTYYRRVIEDQRNRIFDEIIRVLETTDPTNEVIADIKAAKHEQQFSKSIEAIKHAMPSSLLVNGQNPLRLLHSALSEGMHAMSDSECLAIAAAARTVLFEFSDRLAQALRDDAELSKAVALLNKPKSP